MNRVFFSLLLVGECRLALPVGECCVALPVGECCLALPVVSDVFVRTYQCFRRLSDAHRSSLEEGQGVPEEKEEVRTVITSGLLSDRENCGSRGPCCFTVEMINTIASTVEVGKHVKMGEGEQLELGEVEVVTEENRTDYRQYDINKAGENDAVEANRAYHVTETDNEESIFPPPDLEVIM